MDAPAGFTALPTLDATNTITWTNGGTVPAAAYGSQFVVQTSNNLAHWTAVPAGELTANSDGPGGSLFLHPHRPRPALRQARGDAGMTLNHRKSKHLGTSMNPRLSINRTPWLACALGCALVSLAPAASFTWDAGGGTSSWGTGTNWNPDGAAFNNTTDLTFAGIGAQTYLGVNTAGGARTIRSLTFNDTYTTFNVQSGILTVSAPLGEVVPENKISGLEKTGAGP